MLPGDFLLSYPVENICEEVAKIIQSLKPYDKGTKKKR